MSWRADRISFVASFPALVLWLVVALFANASAFAQAGADNPPGLIDGLRRIEANRYGVEVLHPPGWRLTNLMRGDRAFVLALPEDHPSEPAGTVACEVGTAPASLADFQKQIATQGTGKDVDKKLVSNDLLSTIPRGPQTPSLEAIWSFKRAGLGTWFEMKRFVIQNRQLYTFVLNVDQGHFEAYRIEFERMANTAKFRPPETGLQQVRGGYWMHRDYAIGMLLPESWLPALGASERALYFAAGPAQDVFADNVVVLGGKLQPLELETLKAGLPDQVRKADPNSTIVRCDIISVGKQRALESVIRTRRGPLNLTILERRFQGKRFNYEVRFTVLTEHFEKLESQLRESADSFREAALPGKADVI